MSHKRQFGIWIAAALIATIAFLLVMRAQYAPTQSRFALAVNAHPAAGRTVFESKGCARCHGGDASGTDLGPSLRNRAALVSSARVVTALWNHVPRMAEAMQSVRVSYPTMSHEETAQLLSYLFVTGLTDSAGEPQRGAQVFAAKHCSTCHSSSADAPPPSQLVAASPLDFSAALWNHASAMQSKMRRKRIDWPRFDASDILDLLAYVQSRTATAHPDEPHIPDAARGWQLFQSKSCIDCHALSGRETSTPRLTSTSSNAAPALPVRANDGSIPPTLSQFAAAMLNHYPTMNVALDRGGSHPPEFSGGDMADLAVFLYSLRDGEPAGSPFVGASVFVWRGCAACHGEGAAGGSAPALRGRGQSYTAVRLATGLWAHGDRMYDETRRRGQPWPHLEESDIGDLLGFLNTPLENSSAEKHSPEK